MSRHESENTGLNIWKTSAIPSTKRVYLENLTVMKNETDKLYVELTKHIESLKLDEPTKLATLVELFAKFEEVNSGIDRHLLNLHIYINTIRVNHLKCNLSTLHMEEIMNLLQTITIQRQSLQTVDYMSLLDAYNDKKDKDMEFYNPCLALMEKRVFKQILNGLMSILMICNYVTKHLVACDILETLDIKLSQAHHGYM